MSEKQKQLLEDLTANVEKLPIEKQYQLLGVAHGLGMVPASQAEVPGQGEERKCP